VPQTEKQIKNNNKSASFAGICRIGNEMKLEFLCWNLVTRRQPHGLMEQIRAEASALQLDKVHASLSASSLAMRLINTLEALSRADSIRFALFATMDFHRFAAASIHQLY
jgi:hypothetical protein